MSGLCFWDWGLSGWRWKEIRDKVTYSDEGEDVVHVGADVDLHKAHNHSHLLEKELENKREW